MKNRLKSPYRSRGVPVAGHGVYTATKRGEFLGQLPKPAQPLAGLLYKEMDALEALKSEAKKATLTEAKRHPEVSSGEELSRSWVRCARPSCSPSW